MRFPKVEILNQKLVRFIVLSSSFTNAHEITHISSSRTKVPRRRHIIGYINSIEGNDAGIERVAMPKHEVIVPIFRMKPGDGESSSVNEEAKGI